MTQLPPHLEEKMRELADAIQVEIDKIDDPDSKFYRPIGTWRDNWEDGFEAAFQLLMPELREIENDLESVIKLCGFGDPLNKYEPYKRAHVKNARDKLKKLMGEGDV